MSTLYRQSTLIHHNIHHRSGPSSPSPSPFATKDRIYIVNSNYNHYGQSVLRQHSRSAISSAHSTLSLSGSTHSTTSYYNQQHHKRQRLELQSSGEDEDVGEGEGEGEEGTTFSTSGEADDQIMELNADSAMTSSHKTPKPKYFSYRSLINPDSKMKRFLTKLDSDTFSLFSSSSRAQLSMANVNSLPVEVLRLALSYCDDYKTRVSCLYVNHNFYHAIKPLLYEDPLLTSSYRVAQLISSLKEFKNGELIKKLDLSKLSPGVITRSPELTMVEGADHEDDNDAQGDNSDNDLDDNEDGNGLNSPMGPEVLEYAMASWRDWKYRDDPLYGSSMLNSYNLSKSKSNISCDSTVSVGSSLQRILSKWRLIPSAESLEIGNMKESMKRSMVKWRRKLKLGHTGKIKAVQYLSKKPSFREKKKKSSLSSSSTTTSSSANGNAASNREPRSVNFSTLRDPKNQPFATIHPYTNKFLLKYAGMKDLPIGYVLYFIEMCPNLKEVNFAQLILSSDFAIVDNTIKASNTPKMPSLIDTVLGMEHDPILESDVAHYLSDANVYFKTKSYHESEFVKLFNLDVLKHLSQLTHLESLDLSSLTWLNYRNVRSFVQQSLALQNGSLQEVDLTNSGMIRDLRWAKKFESEELKEYFAEATEKVVIVENEFDVLARTIGMDY